MCRLLLVSLFALLLVSAPVASAAEQKSQEPEKGKTADSSKTEATKVTEQTHARTTLELAPWQTFVMIVNVALLALIAMLLIMQRSEMARILDRK